MSLKDWRYTAGLTQRQLALKARVSRATICHLEAQRRPPSPLVACRLATALSSELGVKVETWNLFPRLFHSPQELLAAEPEEGKWL